MKEIVWKDFVSNKKEGEKVFVAPNWKFDSFRTKVFRLARKGYFKKINVRKPYGDHFVRTSKQWVEGDNLRKPVSYSYNINQNK